MRSTTTDTYAPSAVGERIRELRRKCNLPTLAAETVDRFSESGHADALAFGMPGTGKTQAMRAIRHKLVESGDRCC